MGRAYFWRVKNNTTMKKLTLLILTIGFFSIKIFGQTTVDVAETTLKIGGLGGEEVFYYGFTEGDQLIFNFEEVKGKELKEVEIIELPSSSKFMDYKSKKIENKILSFFKVYFFFNMVLIICPEKSFCHPRCL